jgi:hypothetical protein
MEAQDKIENIDTGGAEEEGQREIEKTWPIVPQYVRHEFTDQEKLELSEKIARAVSDIADAQTALKTFQMQIKGRKQEAEAVINSCASKLNEGYEMKNVVCRVVKDYEAGLISYESVDTGEVVHERDMTPEERQMELTETEESAEKESAEEESVEVDKEEEEIPEEDI